MHNTYYKLSVFLNYVNFNIKQCYSITIKNKLKIIKSNELNKCSNTNFNTRSKSHLQEFCNHLQKHKLCYFKFKLIESNGFGVLSATNKDRVAAKDCTRFSVNVT